MAKKQETKKVNKVLLTFLCILSLMIGIASGFLVHYLAYMPTSDTIVSGDLKIHFLELGNNNSGDAILIQVGTTDILVDAGSKTTSLDTIRNYLDEKISDGIIEYVVVTHAHEDHYANFAGYGPDTSSLFYYYQVDNIIQFAQTNQKATNSNGNKTMYGNYLNMVNKEVENGAKLCSVLDSYNNSNGCNRTIDLGKNVELEILNSYYYENKDTSGENNHSVCFMLNQGDNHFLFTGDLESNGEKHLVELNSLPEVVLYKAGHHGSKTSSSEALLSVIKPQIVIITCVAGAVEYSQNLDNVFPTSITLKNIAAYTDKVYVTSVGTIEYDSDKDKYIDTGFNSLNGNIIVTSNRKGITVEGSNNNTLLKDSNWYKSWYGQGGYRTNPPWQIN